MKVIVFLISLALGDYTERIHTIKNDLIILEVTDSVEVDFDKAVLDFETFPY